MPVGTDIVNTKMVKTEDGGHIPIQYQDVKVFFSRHNTKTLLPLRPIDLAIDLEPNYPPPQQCFYNLSVFKLNIFKTFIQTSLAKILIQRSASSAAAFTQFRRSEKEDNG
jgi:hypothetical protein